MNGLQNCDTVFSDFRVAAIVLERNIPAARSQSFLACNRQFLDSIDYTLSRVVSMHDMHRLIGRFEFVAGSPGEIACRVVSLSREPAAGK